MECTLAGAQSVHLAASMLYNAGHTLEAGRASMCLIIALNGLCRASAGIPCCCCS